MRRTVILANGVFPKRGGEPWRLLESARLVVACDGAATAFRRRFRRDPGCIVGDFDSYAGGRAACARTLVVRIAEQDDNDLAKAIRLCRERGWRNPVIVGAAGGREDHVLGNVFRAMAEGVEVVTDCGRFLPARPARSRPAGGASRGDWRLRLRTRPGAPVSVFATDPATRMTSRGLAWPLDSVEFANLYCATLNRATARTVELRADRPFFAYAAL